MIKLTPNAHPNLVKNNTEVNGQANLKGKQERKKYKLDFQKSFVYVFKKYCLCVFPQLRYFSRFT